MIVCQKKNKILKIFLKTKKKLGDPLRDQKEITFCLTCFYSNYGCWQEQHQ